MAGVSTFSPVPVNVPTSLQRSAEQRLDLITAGQTHRALDGLRREYGLRRLLADALDRLPANRRNDPKLAPALEEARQPAATVHLSRRSAPEEAGPQKQFDFSRASLADRWAAGTRDMQKALDLLNDLPKTRGSDGFAVHAIGN